jgi:hypothetical protein
MAITYRSDLAVDLTPTQVDDNFRHLANGTAAMLPGTTGTGVKVDSGGTPTFGWRDLIGDITPKSTGLGAPTLDAFRGGNVRGFRYSAGDDGDAVFHIPHDYVPGTDLFMHLHWSHNGTNISGSLVLDFYVTYAKGHQQANFSAEVAPVLTVGSLNITNTPQYRHRVDEFQLSAASPSATQLDSDNIEVDGLILVHFDTDTIPTITGGSGEPYFLTLDIHYQSTAGSMSTKNKAPSFYA